MTHNTEPRPNKVSRKAIIRLAIWFVAVAVALPLLVATVYLWSLLKSTPGATELRRAEAARPSVLLTSDGQPLAIFGNVQQKHVTLDQVSPDLLNALVATEDARFYEHHGVDLRRTAGALFRTLRGKVEGGSTITQQLARNLFPDEIGRARSIDRKLKEMIVAFRLERNFTKRQILEAYLNNARFLYGEVGIEMAALNCCNKSAADLSLLESATLVAMLKGSAYYNPVTHPDRAKQRRNLVLAQMVRRGTLPAAEYLRLKDEPLAVSVNRQSDNPETAPHFVAQAKKWLLDWAAANNYNLYEDGLVVQTTLDANLQEAATRAVERQADALQAVADVEWAQAGTGAFSSAPDAYVAARRKIEPFAHLWKFKPELLSAFARETPEYRNAAAAAPGKVDAVLRQLLADGKFVDRLKRDKTRLEAGFLAVDPSSGEVKAWVGSRDFGIDQYDHVSQAERQPGSTFKAFVYGAALESGIDPDHLYQDGAVELAMGDGKIWRPTDMHGSTDQPMTLRDGLVYSKNTITVQVSQEVGVARVAALARAMGVDQSRLDAVPSLALGTSPVTLAEMVNAYATIAHQGERVQPIFIKRITDRHGVVVAEPVALRRRAMAQDNAIELLDMMRGVVSRGTGTAVRTRFGIVGDVAGKTGTTQNNTDGWFILMHPGLVAGAWVGFNDARVAMRSSYWGQGGHNAALLVGDFFREGFKGGWIDPKAVFPASRRPPPARDELVAQIAADDSETGAMAAVQTTAPVATEAAPGFSPSSAEPAQDKQRDRPPLTEVELDRVVDAIKAREETPTKTTLVNATEPLKTPLPVERPFDPASSPAQR